MSETPPTNGGQNPAGTPGQSGQSQENAPSLVVMTQYLKDLSFESPRAPGSFKAGQSPQLDVNVDVEGRTLGPDQYEVELSVAARATAENEPVFIVEASYAGAFEIKNVQREQLEMVMLVECPRLLFPFMRQIVADATRNGNFPPLMLEPIDFMGIYFANKAKAQASSEGAPAPTPAPQA
ncbi:MAG: protein-export chaperone SecB [Pseudomonadota bacterium]